MTLHITTHILRFPFSSLSLYLVAYTEQLVGIISVTSVARHASISVDEADIRNSHEYYTDTLDFQFDKELIHEFEVNENTKNIARDIMAPKVHDIDANVYTD